MPYMNIPRIMLAAGSSGSGKTTVTCGILQILKRRGLKVSSFKCGPDYIDPMFHKTVLDTPSKNLDTFFTDYETTCSLMAESASDTDISIIEGVMGYYDGAGITTHTGSSYDIARATATPVILVVNAKGMSMSIAAYIKGFLDYKPDSDIKGVILNQTSEMVYKSLKPVIENELNIPVAGYIPKINDFKLESRHLGLITPSEINDIKTKIDNLALKLEKTLDIDKIISIAESADTLKYKPFNITPVCKYGDIRIAVAKDEAFCFYYEDNLRLLKKLGAELIPFSPLHDNTLPENIHGCLLGGGYPELYLDMLSSNKSMLISIKNALTNQKLPYIAECGGFLYLHKTMENINHNKYKLAGVIDADAVYKGKSQRFGYITLTPENYGDNTCYEKSKTASIKAHEFHYYDSTDNGNSFIAKKPFRDTSWQCIHKTENGLAGFPHLYFYSNPAFAENFVKTCAEKC